MASTVKHDDYADAFRYTGTYGGYLPNRWRCGILFRWSSLWVGAHWSPYNKRLCLNLIPCLTVWVTLPGGITP